MDTQTNKEQSTWWNCYHPQSQNQKSMNIIMTTRIAYGIDQKQGTDALQPAHSIVTDGTML